MVNYAKYLALLNGERDVIKSLEWTALFNRLACEPPPLVERSGLQALQLAKLIFFGDVVDFDDGHSGHYNSSSPIPASFIRCRCKPSFRLEFPCTGTEILNTSLGLA